MTTKRLCPRLFWKYALLFSYSLDGKEPIAATIHPHPPKLMAM
jgi:hypothetical protein